MIGNPLRERAQLALDALLGRETARIPTACLFLMEHAHIERLAGVEPGAYRRDPENVYLACQHAAGVCLVDQFIPDNPLTMGDRGFEAAERKATTGAEQIVCDGIVIDGHEAVVEHLKRFVFPQLRLQAAAFDEDARVAEILADEADVQARLGPDILKTGYAFVRFPTFAYGQYGYEAYFSAYALYPEVIERHFALQADLAVLNNRAAARAYAEGGLPPLYRLDHDMADSRGLLVSPASLDRLWMPHFARALAPMLGTGVRMIWHCDGNLMDLVPRLLAVGVAGFQGFQYEDGMDYPRICRMKTRDGEGLTIFGGVSVTTTLPRGRPADVRAQIDWLVEHGPPARLFLGCSSSVTPGVPWENIAALVEGLAHYRIRGRTG